MAKKPHKCGYKFWVFKFLVTGDKYQSPNEYNLVGLSGQVVLDLCENMPEEIDLAFDTKLFIINQLDG